MASLAIRASKSGPKSVPTGSSRADFVLGSRPSTVRAPAVPKVTPGKASSRDYGKVATPFGNTSLTMRS